MAVAFDATSNGNGGGVTSITWTHTVTSSGSNLGLLIGVSENNTSDHISTVKYNSISCTRILINNSANFLSSIWKKIGPSTGANSVTVTFTSISQAQCGACSFTGCDQVTMIDGQQSATATSTTASVSVTSTATGMIMDNVACDNNASTLTVGGSQTQRWNVTEDADVIGGGSTKVNAGATTMSWTLGASKQWVECAVSIFAAAATDFSSFEFDYSYSPDKNIRRGFRT